MNIWERGVLVGIFFVAVLLRFYNLESTQPFLLDETRDAYIVRAIIRDRIFPLVGPTTSIGQVQLGPAYYYLMAPWLGLFAYQPIGMAYGMAVMGVMTVGLLYRLGKKLIGQQGALIASLLYATNAYVVNNTRTAWNPNPISLFSLLWLWFLDKALQQKRLYPNFVIACGIWALAIQFHYTALFLLPFLLWGGIKLWKETEVENKSLNFGLSLSVGGLLLSPWLWFELSHELPNLGRLLTVLSEGQAATLQPFQWLSQYPGRWHYIVRLVAGDNPVPWLWLFIAMILMGFLGWRAWQGPNQLSAKLLLGAILSGVGGLSLIKGYPMSPHYVAYLFPMIFLAVGWGLDRLMERPGWLRYLGLALVLALVGLQYPLYSFHRPVPRTLSSYQRIAQKLLADNQNQPFNLYVLNSYGDYLGLAYRYFIELTPSLIKTGADYRDLKRLYVIDELNQRPLDPGQVQAYLDLLGVGGQLPGTITHRWVESDAIIYRLE